MKTVEMTNSQKRWRLVAIVAAVAVVLGLLSYGTDAMGWTHFRTGGGPSAACESRLKTILGHEPASDPPIVEDLPGGDVQVNGSWYDPRLDSTRHYLCTVHDGRVVSFDET